MLKATPSNSTTAPESSNVLAFPTKRKKPYPRSRYQPIHREQGVVSLHARRREMAGPVIVSTLSVAELLAALIEVLPSETRWNVSKVLREHPDDSVNRPHAEAAFELLRTIPWRKVDS